MAEIDDIEYLVAAANHTLSEFDLTTGILASLGHSSMRVPGAPSKFVIKGCGYAVDALPKVRPDDMIVCDLKG